MLRVTITIHSNGTISVLVEWITTYLAAGYELTNSPAVRGIVSRKGFVCKHYRIRKEWVDF